MKDYSIFEGIKELRGDCGNFRIEGNKVFEERDGTFIFAGHIIPEKTNILLYDQCCNLCKEKAEES